MSTKTVKIYAYNIECDVDENDIDEDELETDEFNQVSDDAVEEAVQKIKKSLPKELTLDVEFEKGDDIEDTIKSAIEDEIGYPVSSFDWDKNSNRNKKGPSAQMINKVNRAIDYVKIQKERCRLGVYSQELFKRILSVYDTSNQEMYATVIHMVQQVLYYYGKIGGGLTYGQYIMIWFTFNMNEYSTEERYNDYIKGNNYKIIDKNNIIDNLLIGIKKSFNDMSIKITRNLFELIICMYMTDKKVTDLQKKNLIAYYDKYLKDYD